MGKQHDQVTTYIEKSHEFAKPILTHIREVVHRACPGVEEKIKWGFPHFDYKGMMCSMASFNQHCTLNFWKGSLIPEIRELSENQEASAMGQFGKLTSIDDLPGEEVLVRLIREAVRLNDEGVKLPANPKIRSDKQLIIPEDFQIALRANKKASAEFEKFTPGKKKEYVMWITGAKTGLTREKRIATSVEWISEGKSQNWRYMKK